jgi:excisionase family DNA binding protein
MVKSDEQLAYRVPQVARLLGLSEHAVRRMIQRGQLPAHRLGRRLFILQEDLAHVLQTLRRVRA